MYYMVANAVIYRRYVVIGTTKPWPVLSFLCLLTLTSLLFTLSWHVAPSGSSNSFLLGLCIGLATATTLIFHHTVPQVRKPEFWGVPFMPCLPSISIFMNIFLLGSLDGPSYVWFGFFSGLAVLVYVLYSVHASFDAEAEGFLGLKNGEMIRESTESEDDPSRKV